MKPMQNAVGGFVANGLQTALGGMMPFAKGGSFSQGRVMPFAKGGVVAQPDQFSDARRAWADGRGRARGDHAVGARA